jgi:pyrimidine operon attenuation protein/uracil phosphoribosyltransferase
MELDQLQLASEKSSLAAALQTQIEEAAGLQTELLKLQANHERDRVLVESQRTQLAEAEQRLDTQYTKIVIVVYMLPLILLSTLSKPPYDGNGTK